jgi:hypothetical protein
MAGSDDSERPIIRESMQKGFPAACGRPIFDELSPVVFDLVLDRHVVSN